MKHTTQDKHERALLTLEFYMHMKKEVHINIIKGVDSGLFRNGYILEVNLKKKSFTIIDRVRGNLSYSIYHIKPYISPCKNKGEQQNE